jgi:hypothetical protein
MSDSPFGLATKPDLDIVKLAMMMQFPEAIADFKVCDLERFARISAAMLDGQAYGAASGPSNVDKGFRRTFIKIHKSLSSVLKLDIIDSRQGSSTKFKNDANEAEKLKAILSALLFACEHLKKVQSHVPSRRPEVKIGTIQSIASYLGPALIEHMAKTPSPSDIPWPPSLYIYHGEYSFHLLELLTGYLDFVITSNSVTPPEGTVAIPLSYRSAEQGFIFRIPRTRESTRFNNDLIEAIKTGEAHKIRRALIESPFALRHWRLYRGKDPVNQKIAQYLSASGTSLTAGVRYYVPTARMARTLAIEGLAVALGHKPREEDRTAPTKPVYELGGCAGYDPGNSESLLGFLPFSVVNDNVVKEKFPQIPRGAFQIIVRGHNKKPDPSHVSKAAIETIRQIQLLLKSNAEENRFLTWDTTSETLIHEDSPLG